VEPGNKPSERERVWTSDPAGTQMRSGGDPIFRWQFFSPRGGSICVSSQSDGARCLHRMADITQYADRAHGSVTWHREVSMAFWLGKYFWNLAEFALRIRRRTSFAPTCGPV
jgi:hypothetical protein